MVELPYGDGAIPLKIISLSTDSIHITKTSFWVEGLAYNIRFRTWPSQYQIEESFSTTPYSSACFCPKTVFFSWVFCLQDPA